MAWNLINEPRCEQPKGCDMQGWVAEMAAHTKKADPHHLVTLGADGFYGAASCLADRYNPFLWAGHTGADFMPNHAVKDIDYAAIHLWPVRACLGGPAWGAASGARAGGWGAGGARRPGGDACTAALAWERSITTSCLPPP